MARGRLITIEGLDGAGKSTLASALREALAARGHRVELLREPGGVELSERIRALVKDPALDVAAARRGAALRGRPRAARARSALQPLLDDGAVVLLDRFVDSSLAYQGAGRALGVEQVRAINRFATGGAARPTARCCCASRPPPGARARPGAASGPTASSARTRRFFAAIAAAYDELARRRARSASACSTPSFAPAQRARRRAAALDDLLALGPAARD